MKPPGDNPVRRPRSRWVAWFLCALLLGCEDSCNRVTSVTFTFADSDPALQSAMAVGDSAQLVAQAVGLASVIKFDSRTDPAAFRWVVGDTTIATVSTTGMVRARRAGQTDIVAYCEGVESLWPMTLFVTRPVAAMEVIASATPAGVGDTVTISIAAMDAEGESIEGVPFTIRIVEGQGLVFLGPRQGLFAPSTVSLRASTVGAATVSATSVNVLPDRLRSAGVSIAVIER